MLCPPSGGGGYTGGAGAADAGAVAGRPARRAAPGRKAAACRPPPCPVTSQTCPVTSRSRRRLIACNDARCSVCSRRQAQHRRFSNSRLGPNGRRLGPSGRRPAAGVASLGRCKHAVSRGPRLPASAAACSRVCGAACDAPVCALLQEAHPPRPRLQQIDGRRRRRAALSDCRRPPPAVSHAHR